MPQFHGNDFRRHSPVRPQPSPTPLSPSGVMSGAPALLGESAVWPSSPPPGSEARSALMLRGQEVPNNGYVPQSNGYMPGNPGFVALRLWIEQEVESHVRTAMRELVPQGTPGVFGKGAASPSEDSRQQHLEDIVSSVQEEQGRLAAELRKLQHASPGAAASASGRQNKHAGLVRELFDMQERASARSPDRHEATSSSTRLPGIHSIHLNLVDQAKRTRSLGEEVASLQEMVAGLEREVRATVSTTTEAKRISEAVEARFSETSSVMRTEIQDAVARETQAAMEKFRLEEWAEHRAEIDTLLSQWQAEHRAEIGTLFSQLQAEHANMRSHMQAMAESRAHRSGTFGSPTEDGTSHRLASRGSQPGGFGQRAGDALEVPTISSTAGLVEVLTKVGEVFEEVCAESQRQTPRNPTLLGWGESRRLSPLNNEAQGPQLHNISSEEAPALASESAQSWNVSHLGHTVPGGDFTLGWDFAGGHPSEESLAAQSEEQGALSLNAQCEAVLETSFGTPPASNGLTAAAQSGLAAGAFAETPATSSHCREEAAVASKAASPAWTRGEIEKPAGVRDMGGWSASFFTEEQQARLNVDESGNPRQVSNKVAQRKTPHRVRGASRWNSVGHVFSSDSEEEEMEQDDNLHEHHKDVSNKGGASTMPHRGTASSSPAIQSSSIRSTVPAAGGLAMRGVDLRRKDPRRAAQLGFSSDSDT